MYYSTVFVLVATFFVYSHQLPTSVSTAQSQDHPGPKPAVITNNKPNEQHDQHPLPSSFLKDDKTVSTDSSTRKTEERRPPVLSVSPYRQRDSSSTSSPSRVTPVEPAKPSIYNSPSVQSNPSPKITRQTSPSEAFKAHESASSGSNIKTTENTKTTESSNRNPTGSTLRKTDEHKISTAADVNAKKPEESNNRPVLQKTSTVQHGIVKRDANIFVDEPNEFGIEPTLGGKKFKVFPSFMG